MYNPETNRVILTRDVKWEDRKNTDPTETLKMFREAEEGDLVPGIEEDVIPTSKPEDNMPVHVIPNKGEITRRNEIYEKSSEITYLKTDVDVDVDTSAYDRVLNALKKLNTSYNPMMQNMHDPVIKRNYKVTGDTRVIPIVDHKDNGIWWECSTSISICT